MKLLTNFFFVLIIFVSIAFAQSKNSFSSEQLNKLDLIATQDVPQNSPGIAVGIVKNGEIIYEKYAGYADLKDNSLIDSSTRFNIASNGKQFTALAILVLIKEGKLKLNDDIRKFFPNLYPEITNKITIENLLNHSSGIRDVYDLWALQGITWWKKTFDNRDAMRLVERQKELNFQPGTKYLYSNTNYILLAEIVSKVSGKTFIEFTNELFTKLTMPNTSFENDYTKIRGKIAKPYFNFDKWTDYNWIWNVYGDGNIFSTMADQLQWEKTIQTKNNSFLSQGLIEKSQNLMPKSTIKNYGYGLEFGDYKGFPYKFHEGATGAWKATTIRFPQEKLSLVTLTNSGKTIPSDQTRQMADVILGLENQKIAYPTKPTQAGKFISIDNILGVYQTESDFTFKFEKRGEDLFLIRVGRNDTKLVRDSDNIFRQWNDADFKQEFKLNSKGEMEVTAYYTSHAPYTLKRINSNWSGFDYKALEGKFINNETNVILEVTYISDKNYQIKFTGQVKNAILLSPTKLIAENYSIEIPKPKKVKINEFFISSDRIQKVRFSRLSN
jgi:CubicO group peptidase (beta-lactamase class C family)